MFPAKTIIILSAVYITTMFKELLRGLSKFFTTQRVVILVVFIVIGWALYNYSASKNSILDKMDTGVAADAASHGANSAPTPVPAPGTPSDYTPKSTVAPNELLPVDSNNGWAGVQPITQGGIAMPDLLQAGYHIGLDTIGQTLRNPNYQLRSDPLIPKAEVGPWMQSTIEPDVGRVPLELGATM